MPSAHAHTHCPHACPDSSCPAVLLKAGQAQGSFADTTPVPRHLDLRKPLQEVEKAQHVGGAQVLGPAPMSALGFVNQHLTSILKVPPPAAAACKHRQCAGRQGDDRVGVVSREERQALYWLRPCRMQRLLLPFCAEWNACMHTHRMLLSMCAQACARLTRASSCCCHRWGFAGQALSMHSLHNRGAAARDSRIPATARAVQLALPCLALSCLQIWSFQSV